MIVRVADFGALPDTGADATAAVNKAIGALAGVEGAAVLAFAAGRYDFYPDEAVKEAFHISNTASEDENPDITRTIGMFFSGLRDVTVEGNGALFVFHGRMTVIAVDRCEGVALRNFRMDYARPTISEMTVETLGESSMEVRIHPDSRHTAEGGKLVWIGEGWSHTDGPAQAFDPATHTTWRIDNPVAAAHKAERLGPDRWRLHYRNAPPSLRTGWTVQMRDGLRDQVGVWIHRSRDVAIAHADFYYLHGLGIVGQYSDNLSVDGVRIMPRPESGRTAAAFADGVHLSGCRGRVRIANCRFEGLHDDAINVHGTHLRIVGRPEPNQVRVRFMHPQTYGFDAFFPGDEIEFVRGDSLCGYAAGTVASVDPIGPRDILLTLDAPAPEDIRPHDVVENVTWTPEVEIADNRFAAIPTRGVLLTTRRQAVIERNLFERTAMSAILVADDAESWFESGRVEALTVRANRFVECGGGRHPVIAIAPENRTVDADAPVHRNIRVEANRFQLAGAGGIVLDAKSTRSIRFAGNEIAASSAGGGPRTVAEAIRLTACSEVTIADNSLSERKSGRERA